MRDNYIFYCVADAIHLFLLLSLVLAGGSCEENVIAAGYCGNDPRFSNSAGCEPPPKPRPVDNGPPQMPTLDSITGGLPKLPF